ncbi:hypothetical protein AQUCO_02600300v1 [Aquilegia coerulea]|uniref:Reverse transcriptase zinc-binding domain-containing protein n=1 Tax=Aquilegia coerulea TaxID=218851 RepID=A0A2G5D8A9_AQUCA|nr:hypothetical protein AQUCO_02600300v1 [Aquilegia coerulea]
MERWPNIILNRWGTMVWKPLPYAVVWVTCSVRNDCTFNEKIFTVRKIVMKTRAMVWYWLMRKVEQRGHRFSEMLNNWGITATGVAGLKKLMTCDIFFHSCSSFCCF